MNKEYLRKKYLEKRLSLSTDQILAKSLKIANKILGIDEVRNAKFISCNLPINNEVDTVPIIKRLMRMNKKILLPSYLKNTRSYKFVQFSNWENLKKGPYGILQPHDSKENTMVVKPRDTSGVKSGRYQESTSEVSIMSLDVAILPGVAFDKKSVRLGYGKGVFDRILRNSKAIKIGLAYDFQIVDDLPREEHDLIMDLIVTESRIIVHSS